MPIRRTGALLTTSVLLASVSVPVAAPAVADGDLTLDQWGVDAVNAADGWETSTGAGVTVALLDTGVDDTHPDLGSSPDASDTEAPSSVVTGPDLTGEDLEPGAESFGVRGTKLAGIIAASGHGQEHSGGAMGIAPDAAVLSVRVAGEPDGDAHADAAVVAEGLRHAVQEGVQVALLPVGLDADDETIVDAVETAESRGVVVVAPEGSAVPGALAATAVDEDLNPVSPDWGRAHLAAPGTDIVTTSAGGDYAQAEGAEAAAAFVAGTAALIRSAFPHLRPDEVSEAMTSSASPISGAPEVAPEAEQVPPEAVPDPDPAPPEGGVPGETQEAPVEGLDGLGVEGGVEGAANGLEQAPDAEADAAPPEEAPAEDEADDDSDPVGLLHVADALTTAEEIADESEPFDEDLVSSEEDQVSLLWLAGAATGLVIGAGVLLFIVLRRRWSNPYDLPPRETFAVDEPPDPQPRRGRRRRR
ncbi:S8 family serine peptidase [Spiractinospora alimapuensis]|uniref:S8 family serine peptidase n=1 Tax=Spiractinospora alimapuensis TaxID=2820884 RepID=UPI001F1EDAAA|nr:S8 family serine peptidase [Spiractinospora alimapuensis]QVQ50300.1 S8 family serine peptidase [Spiractinospora alimapuensis]